MTYELIRNADGQTHASPPREDSSPCRDLQVIGIQVEWWEALVERTHGLEVEGVAKGVILGIGGAGYF